MVNIKVHYHIKSFETIFYNKKALAFKHYNWFHFATVSFIKPTDHFSKRFHYFSGAENCPANEKKGKKGKEKKSKQM